MAAQDVASLREALNTSLFPPKILHLAAAATSLSRLPLDTDDTSEHQDSTTDAASPALRLMGMLVTEVGRRARGCDFRVVSNVLGAAAKIGYSPDDATMSALLSLVMRPEFEVRHCRTPPAAPQSPSPAPGLDPDLDLDLESVPGSGSGRSASTSRDGHKLAHAGAESVSFTPSSLRAAHPPPSEKTMLQKSSRPQELANFAHALAVLGVYDCTDGAVIRVSDADLDPSMTTDSNGVSRRGTVSGLWSVITQTALPLLPDFKPQAVTRDMSGVAVGRRDVSCVLPATGGHPRQVARHLDTFLGTELAMVSVSLATAGCSSCGEAQRSMLRAALAGLRTAQGVAPGPGTHSSGGGSGGDRGSDSGSDSGSADGGGSGMDNSTSGGGGGSSGDRGSRRKGSSGAGSSGGRGSGRGGSITVDGNSRGSSSSSSSSSGRSTKMPNRGGSRLELSVWNTRAITGILWGGTKTLALSAEHLSEIAPLLLDLVPSCDRLELANFLWAYATFGDYDPVLYKAFAKAALRFAPTLQHTDLSRICWAFARAGHVSSALLSHALASRTLELLEGSCANPDDSDTDRSRGGGGSGSSSGHEHVPDLGSHAPSGRRRSSRGVANSGAFTPQNLSNLAWAFARQSYYSEPLFTQLSRAAQRDMGSFCRVEVLSTLWAFATIQHYDGALMSSLAGRVAVIEDSLGASQICKIAWGFAVLVTFDSRVFQAASRLVLAALLRPDSNEQQQQQQQQQQQRSWTRQESSIPASLLTVQLSLPSPTSWGQPALAAGKAPNLPPAARSGSGEDGSVSPQDIVTLLWACATVQYQDPALLRAMSSSLEGMPLEEFEASASGIYQAAYMTQVGRGHGGPPRGGGGAAVGVGGGPLPRDAGHPPPANDRRLVRDRQLVPAREPLTRRCREQRQPPNERSPHHQQHHHHQRKQQQGGKHVHVHVQHQQLQQRRRRKQGQKERGARTARAAVPVPGPDRPSRPSPPSNATRALFSSLGGPANPRTQPGVLLSRMLSAERCRLARSQYGLARADVTVSALQQQVFRTLRAMRLAPEMEVDVAGGMFSVDVGLVVDGQAVAVEVDGPHHFCRNVQNHPLGSTVARDRSLQALCDHLIVVPWFEWTLLRGSIEGRKSYMAARLREIGQARAGPFFSASGNAARNTSDSGSAGSGLTTAGVEPSRQLPKKKAFNPQITVSRKVPVQQVREQRKAL
ncbi:MAG: hypothetical protein WDW36_007516 [Sanguina aurantia]